MSLPNIDFRRIRPHRGSLHNGFEELTRQLVLAEGLSDVADIEHRGPGADGGVEVLVKFMDGTSWGWQSKYFPDGFGASQLQQLKDSFASAIDHYGADNKGRLTKYIVSVPYNLSGSGARETSDARARWNDFTKWAKATSLKAVAREIGIELWDETTLIRRLQNHDGPYPGILTYWFDGAVFTSDWFRRQLDSAIAALDERYHPEDHVDVEALRPFDVVLHRDQVRTDLHRDFEEARAIYPVPADVAGEDVIPLDSSWLKPLNDALESFIALDRFVAEPAAEAWPVQKWREAWNLLVYERLVPAYDERSQAQKAAGHEWNSERGQKLRRRLGLGFQQREVFGATWHPYLSVEHKRAALFVGEAGAGKSHLLARAAVEANREGAPTLLLLGQDFNESDPRTSILRRVDLPTHSFNAFLGALDAAALAAQRPALLVIDALNEGEGLSIWPRELARLLEELHRFPRLRLAVSCRLEYLEAAIPRSLHDRFLRLDVRGFRTFEEQERAAEVYLDRRGIIRPAGPFLDPEFTNPFFLRIAAESLALAGEKIFPRGLRGAKQIFRFVLDMRGRFLNAGRDGTDDLISPLTRSLHDLARSMAAVRQDYLSLSEAAIIVKNAFDPYPPPSGKTWLDVLRGNGFVRKDLLRAVGGDGFVAGDEVVRFTFQRLADQLMAESLLGEVTDIDQAFTATGPLSFVIDYDSAKREVSIRYKWAGLAAALWIGIAEKFNREFCDLPGIRPRSPSEETFYLGFQEPFRESVRWRVPDAFTNRTHEVAKWLFQNLGPERLSLYLEFALVPSHPWNMDWIGSVLAKQSLPERDASWSSVLTEPASEGYKIAIRIVDWCQKMDLSYVEGQILHLTLVTLGWFLAVTNRSLRDRATKALAALFFRHPECIHEGLKLFAGTNDEYVRERVFAAAYGAVLHLRAHPQILCSCAEIAYESIFARESVPRHMMLRDYARGLIEVASARGVLSSEVDLERCRPPYESPPITDWPSPVTVKAVTDEQRASSIFSSTVGWISKNGGADLAGDFGRYTMGIIRSAFSAEPRSNTGPASPGKQKSLFWDKVRKSAPNATRITNELLATDLKRKARRESFVPKIETKEEPFEVTMRLWDEKDPEILMLSARVEELESELRSELTPELLEEFEQGNFLAHDRDEKPYRFDLRRAQSWVAQRALELGWSAEVHGEKEKEFSRFTGRTDHQIERIGKKYQWIAFNELCGYLIDYHWYFSDWGDVVLPFDRVDTLNRRDIDPSFWRTEGMGFEPDPEGPSVSGYRTDFGSNDVQDAIAWTKTVADLPEPARLIESRDEQGDEWWVTTWWYRDTDYMAKQQSTGAMRTAQASINMILVREVDIARFVQAARGRNFGNDRLLGAGETAHVFIGEHAWDTGSIDSASEITLDEDYYGVPYGIPTVRLQTKRGEYDHSDTIDHAILAPNSKLIARMKLRIAGPTSETFVTESGRAAFMDLSFSSRLPEIGVVNAKSLERALAEEEFRPVWIFWAEKDGGRGRGEHFVLDHSNLSRTVFGGCYWRTDNGWQSSGIWRVNGDD
jgi:hypothetical protein